VTVNRKVKKPKVVHLIHIIYIEELEAFECFLFDIFAPFLRYNIKFFYGTPREAMTPGQQKTSN